MLVVDPEQAVIMVQFDAACCPIAARVARFARLGFRVRLRGRPGLQMDNTDAWFTGFYARSGRQCVGLVFDNREGGRRLIEKRSRRQITGGSGAAPIWAAFYEEYR